MPKPSEQEQAWGRDKEVPDVGLGKIGIAGEKPRLHMVWNKETAQGSFVGMALEWLLPRKMLNLEEQL